MDEDGFEGDFYEDDEPLEKIEAAYAAGEKHVTGLPTIRRSAILGRRGTLTVVSSTHYLS